MTICDDDCRLDDDAFENQEFENAYIGGENTGRHPHLG